MPAHLGTVLTPAGSQGYVSFVCGHLGPLLAWGEGPTMRGFLARCAHDSGCEDGTPEPKPRLDQGGRKLEDAPRWSHGLPAGQGRTGRFPRVLAGPGDPSAVAPHRQSGQDTSDVHRDLWLIQMSGPEESWVRAGRQHGHVAQPGASGRVGATVTSQTDRSQRGGGPMRKAGSVGRSAEQVHGAGARGRGAGQVGRTGASGRGAQGAVLRFDAQGGGK